MTLCENAHLLVNCFSQVLQLVFVPSEQLSIPVELGGLVGLPGGRAGRGEAQICQGSSPQSHEVGTGWEKSSAHHFFVSLRLLKFSEGIKAAACWISILKLLYVSQFNTYQTNVPETLCSKLLQIRVAIGIILTCPSRLSYHQRIADTTGANFESMLPKKPMAKYKYELEGAGNPSEMLPY